MPLIEVSVDGESENKPLLNRAYQVIDKQSYLDWGLTSDYLGGEVDLNLARVLDSVALVDLYQLIVDQRQVSA